MDLFEHQAKELFAEYGIPVPRGIVAHTAEEARAAPEAFVTSCSQTVMPVVRIDGHTLGEGRPGPLTQRLREEFRRFAQVS